MQIFFYKRKVQIVINSVARFVLNKGKKTKIHDLMEGSGLMFFTKLEEFHLLVLLWKTNFYQNPRTLTEKFNMNDQSLMEMNPARLQIVSSSYRHRVASYWNLLPGGIEKYCVTEKFKKATEILD